MKFAIFGLVHQLILGRSLVHGCEAPRCHPRGPGLKGEISHQKYLQVKG